MTKLAIVGSGIAGLGCAHFLHGSFDITVFEQDGHVGGHSNTIEAEEPGTRRPVPIDTGFMVFNRATYPNLCRLFELLAVATKPAPMSFSVRHSSRNLEFCGSSVSLLFAQRRNLFRPSFYRLLSAIDRFNREAIEGLQDRANEAVTLEEYVRRRAYGEDFIQLYLLPMSSAVWSTPPALMLKFPAVTLLRFFHNHGFLGLHTQHPWLTVVGGARKYVEKLISPWKDRLRTGEPVVRISRPKAERLLVHTAGETHAFDQVILACHADQALGLLESPTAMEQTLLSPFRYQANVATLHTDTRVMPRTRRAWSSWNYEIAPDSEGQASTSTHYWMNSLQGVSDRENYFVSINRPDAIDPDKVVRRVAYEHPLFSIEAVRAQGDLPGLNQSAKTGSRTFFAGSYFRYGFHEDAFASAVELSRLLLGRDPWGDGALNSLGRPREQFGVASSA